MAEQLIARSPLAALKPASPSNDVTFDFVTRVVASELGRDHAALFTEPALSNEPGHVDWRSETLGAVQNIAALEPDEARALLDRLKVLVADISDLADRFDADGSVESRRKASTLRNALQVPDPERAIFRVGDQPRLILWGYVTDKYPVDRDLLTGLFVDARREPSAPPATFVSNDPPPRVLKRFLPTAERLTVGRSAGHGGVVIDHPGVSARHAEYRVENGDLTLRDLGSREGTFVNGERLSGKRKITPEDRVDIGPFRFDYDGSEVEVSDSSATACLSLRGVTRDVKLSGQREPLRILDNVNIDIQAGEFVCIIGMSGSGKSTLMNAMSGRVVPSSGQVRYNGLDLYRNFDLLKQSIAMVPQFNLLHETLTLSKALDYTARLRLPSDTKSADRAKNVSGVLEDVGLSERGPVRIARLSGGQKKRASLASELVDRPSLLFLDEMTSGLDERTDEEIMALLRTLAEDGMTIVCVTHTLANIEAYCHRLIVMAEGGVMVYSGDPSEAPAHFGVERLADIFKAIPQKPTADWRALHDEDASTFARHETNAATAKSSRPGAISRAGTGLRQVSILCRRNLSLLISDPKIWSMALLQSLLIGLLIGYAFSEFGPAAVEVNSKIALLLLLCMSGLWVGCNAASKDIVGELQIFQHECDVNLSPMAFVTSKLFVTGLFTALQMGIVFAIVLALAEGIPGDPALQLGYALLGTLAGCTLGLIVSSFTSTTEQAATIVPLMLVPQLVLCGVIVPHLPELADTIAQRAVITHVLIETMEAVFIEVDGPINKINPDTGTPEPMEGVPILENTLIAVLHIAIGIALAMFITIWRNAGRQKLR